MAQALAAPSLETWGIAADRLLRAARIETSRSGGEAVLAEHLLLAAIDQPEVHQALRAVGQPPDVYAMRGRLASSAIAPSEYSEETPLSDSAREALQAVREKKPREHNGMLYLLVLKRVIEHHACRLLLVHGGVDPAVLDEALARID